MLALSQRFAELDPYCPSMLEAASESFRAGADASRLSLEVLRRLSSKLGALCRQSLRGTPTIKPMVRKVRHDTRPIPGRDSRSLDEADMVSAADVGELRHLLPAAKLTARRRSVKVRPVLASPHHPRCPLSLRRSAAGPPGSTLIASL